MLRHRVMLACGFLLACAASPLAAQPAPVEFHLVFTKNVSAEPFTGRVFVMLSKPAIKDVPQRISWTQPQPFFAQEVKNWRPGTALIISMPEYGYPGPLAKLAKDTYSMQAVMDFGLGRDCITSVGNGYSTPIRQEIDPAASGPIKVVIDQVNPQTPFKESDRTKLVEMESKLLSSFHGRPVQLRAAVLLPKSYAESPEKNYPAIYEIPGFGGTHQMIQRAVERNATDVAGVEMIYVMLDPSCPLGHHVFADSANNGPWGQALISELIPRIEASFRVQARPAARFVTGHSSGGWSSLWLQTAYPDYFGGVWSTAPDPVDFRDFQRVDIYAPGVNLFVDEKGEERPLIRKTGKVAMNYRPFSDVEHVMGHGGQLGSFEAVFSPRGGDGKPMPLWDRKSGAIDPKTAQSWERYDIRLQLERNWPELAPKLAGKIHVYMGAEDNYFLEGATRLLQKSLAGLGSDAVIELFPGRDHSSLMTTELRQRIAREMAERYRQMNPTKN